MVEIDSVPVFIESFVLIHTVALARCLKQHKTAKPFKRFPARNESDNAALKRRRE
jgi:hypothetical protein